MNRAATFPLFLLALPLAAPAKDLIGVFEDALHNDPVIRQADANRLAARESKPQALSALLPQLNGTAGGALTGTGATPYGVPGERCQTIRHLAIPHRRRRRGARARIGL